MTDHPVVARLRELETALWRAETRFDRDLMEASLAPDFVEFGRSGRVYSRDETLAIPAQPISATLPLAEFRVAIVAPDIALVTYRSEVRYGDAVEVGNRSSLWLRTPTGWRLWFHQGTAVS